MKYPNINGVYNNLFAIVRPEFCCSNYFDKVLFLVVLFKGLAEIILNWDV